MHGTFSRGGAGTGVTSQQPQLDSVGLVKFSSGASRNLRVFLSWASSSRMHQPGNAMGPPPPALPDRLNHRKLNHRVWNIWFSLVPCSTQKPVVIHHSQTPIPEFGSGILAALDKTTLPSCVKASRRASLKQLLLDSNHRPLYKSTSFKRHKQDLSSCSHTQIWVSLLTKKSALMKL